MIYTEKTKKAMKLAYQAHSGQFDKGGVPYIFHPIHLAEQMDTEDETITALLHDVVEDTDITLDDLKNEGFSDEIVEAVSCMTHDKTVTYFDYVKKVKKNKMAKKVKKEDLKHNSDITRITNASKKDKERLEKYAKAIKILEEEQ